MPRRDAWTLKALRALLACLCVVLAFPAASAADPAFRPVAAAFAHVSPAPAPAIASEVQAATAAPQPAPATGPREARFVPKTPREVAVRDGRRLYLEKLALLC